MKKKIEIEVTCGYQFYAYEMADFNSGIDEIEIYEYAETLNELLIKAIDSIFDKQIQYSLNGWHVYPVFWVIDKNVLRVIEKSNEISSKYITNKELFDLTGCDYFKKKSEELKKKIEENKRIKLEKQEREREEKERKQYEELKKKFEGN